MSNLNSEQINFLLPKKSKRLRHASGGFERSGGPAGEGVTGGDMRGVTLGGAKEKLFKTKTVCSSILLILTTPIYCNMQYYRAGFISCFLFSLDIGPLQFEGLNF